MNLGTLSPATRAIFIGKKIYSECLQYSINKKSLWEIFDIIEWLRIITVEEPLKNAYEWCYRALWYYLINISHNRFEELIYSSNFLQTQGRILYVK
jgi:hypothetical protein